MNKVGIVDVRNFESVAEAVKSAVKIIEPLPYDVTRAQKILIKPNLLIAKKHACTRPSIVEGTIQYLLEAGVSSRNIFIGDSPGQFKKDAKEVAEEVGIYQIAEEYDVAFVNFEHKKPYKETIENSIHLDQYYVSKQVKECDLLINLPRLKTHGEATTTGAIKNYWGIIPGGLKAKFHLLGKNPDEFGKVLADNFAWIVQNKPKRMTIFDLDKVMQGKMGPVSGEIVDWNLVMAGTDELALDLIALEIGDFSGEDVPHIKNAIERNLGTSELTSLEVLGISIEEARELTPKFKVPNRFMTKLASFITSNLVYKVTKKIPVLDSEKCVKCGQCAQICPAQGIEFENGSYPTFQRKDCISCLCCAELCTQQAISSKLRGIGGLFHSY